MKKLTYILTISILWLLSFTAGFAQSDSKLFTIKGEVVDETSSEPVPFLQVALFEEGKSAPQTSSTTDSEGEFILKAGKGKYSIKFFMIGYEDKEISDLEVDKNLNLRKVTLVNESQELQEVVVQGTRQMMSTNVEGLTINPDQNLLNIGGTLLDILRNTPSIRVGDDGSVSLRGSTGTNVLINGRNSSLTQNLDRIPASAIEQIKVINNPNARYDAEAAAGIIDVILKQGDDLGTNGGIDAVYGTRGRMSAGAQINHRAIKYNVYAGYNFRRWRDVGRRSLEREVFEEKEFLQQETATQRENTGHNFNYGADYYFGNNILSYEGIYSSSLDQQVNTLHSKLSEVPSDQLLLEYVRRNNEWETDDGFDNAFIYERSFDDKERSFKVSATQSYTNQYKTQNIDIFRDASTPDPSGLDDQEKAVTDEKRFNYIFQADYVHPLPENMKLEAGLKSNLRNFEYDYDYSRLNESGLDFIEDPAISNRFDYKDRIHAAHMIMSRAWEKLDVVAGLRGEYTTFSTYLYNTDHRARQQYFNLFPSLQALYNFTEQQGVKFTYSRRIERPTAWRLNPFPDITDSLNVRRGNPNLQPEMIHSLELGHLYEGPKAGFTTNLFYRHTSGQLDYLTFIEDGISYSQPENLNNAQAYGVEVIGSADLMPWWSVSSSFTGFRIKVDGSNLGEEFVNQGYAFNTKANADFKLPHDFTFQMVFNYDSPEIEAQGRDLSQYFLDLSMRKGFFDNKASLSLSLRDVFDTRRFAGNSLTNTFSQTFYAKRETRILLLSARYNL